MIKQETIKELRKNAGLTQEQLGRAVFLEGATISMYESGKRVPSIDTLEAIANVFGYTLELSLIKDKDSARGVDFYNDKSTFEIASMTVEDMVDYLFVKFTDIEMCRFCHLNNEVYDIIDMKSRKNILNKYVEKYLSLGKEALISVLNEEHRGYEQDYYTYVSIVQEYLKTYKENIEKFFNGFSLDKAYYIRAYAYTEFSNGYWVLESAELLDENEESLGVNLVELPLVNTYEADNFDMPVDETLEDYLSSDMVNGLGMWIKNNATIKIKL